MARFFIISVFSDGSSAHYFRMQLIKPANSTEKSVAAERFEGISRANTTTDAH